DCDFFIAKRPALLEHRRNGPEQSGGIATKVKPSTHPVLRFGGMDLSSQVGLRLSEDSIDIDVVEEGRNGPEQSGGIATLNQEPSIREHFGGMDLSSQVGLRLLLAVHVELAVALLGGMDLSSQVGLRHQIWRWIAELTRGEGGMDLSSRVELRPLRKTPCTQERNLGGMDLSSQVGLRPFFSPPIAVGVGGGRRNGPEQSGGIATL